MSYLFTVERATSQSYDSDVKKARKRRSRKSSTSCSTAATVAAAAKSYGLLETIGSDEYPMIILAKALCNAN